MGSRSLGGLIRRPVITEKAAYAQQYHNAHVFEVDAQATKLQIKQAVEHMFDVKVKSVRTMIMPRKTKRFGRHYGQVSKWKKAVVCLKEGQTIQVVEGQ